MGKVATYPLPPRGFPTASERGGSIRGGPQVGKVDTPCRLGGPHIFTAGGRITSGGQVGKVAT